MPSFALCLVPKGSLKGHLPNFKGFPGSELKIDATLAIHDKFFFKLFRKDELVHFFLEKNNPFQYLVLKFVGLYIFLYVINIHSEKSGKMLVFFEHQGQFVDVLIRNLIKLVGQAFEVTHIRTWGGKLRLNHLYFLFKLRFYYRLELLDSAAHINFGVRLQKLTFYVDISCQKKTFIKIWLLQKLYYLRS